MTDQPPIPERTARSVPPKMRPLRMRHVLAAVAVGLLAVVLAVSADWLIFRPADSDTWADIIRSTAFALAFMAAVPAGYVAYRRQQTAEAEHQTAEAEHQLDQDKERRRQVELDDANVRATAKDFRDRYTAAAAQIGSDKAPIRLAGVYALAQLADEWGRTEPDQRQTCIDVLCSYLRMPWPLTASEDAAEQERLDRVRIRAEETRVRETILRVIATHLHKDRDSETGWHQNEFDFTGAQLPHVRMASVRLEGTLIAFGARFSGDARFEYATFSGPAEFDQATFSWLARFDQAAFSRPAEFMGATFSEGAWFSGATFSEDASFGGATFSGDALFSGATFSGDASFGGATFSGNALFSGATFSGDAWFEDATFSGPAQFSGARFYSYAWFEDATFSGPAEFDLGTFAKPPSVASGACRK